MALVERQADHRHLMDKRELRANLLAHVLGVVLSFTLALAVMYMGYKLVQHDHELAGYTALLAGASGIIGSVYKSIRKQPE